mmetsp:Transcript_23757/g.74743  ORF Transcript_23757/g.74743 Transcript_23757/m.74743 type:complete len:206 (-) Transcript_23757:151-768(-)
MPGVRRGVSQLRRNNNLPHATNAHVRDSPLKRGDDLLVAELETEEVLLGLEGAAFGLARGLKRASVVPDGVPTPVDDDAVARTGRGAFPNLDILHLEVVVDDLEIRVDRAGLAIVLSLQRRHVFHLAIRGGILRREEGQQRHRQELHKLAPRRGIQNWRPAPGLPQARASVQGEGCDQQRRRSARGGGHHDVSARVFWRGWGGAR